MEYQERKHHKNGESLNAEYRSSAQNTEWKERFASVGFGRYRKMRRNQRMQEESDWSCVD